ncbi:hypothetical protein F5884DRAFT_455577 [Xylogone sp. PMI_703]|nr:hypothetical protein F5884DRAFT_455577 [Xylogone sp. PMI_703]
MSSPNKRKNRHYEWTPFEMHTLLCLMAKGEHCWTPSKKTDETEAKKHAYLNVATLLNKAIHDKDYDNDIDKREVARMIDQVLQEKKGAMAYIARQPARRLTRGMKQVWERNPPISFTGSIFEWEHGRKAKVLGTKADARVTKAHVVEVGRSVKHIRALEVDPEDQAYYWNQARALTNGTAGNNNSTWGGPSTKSITAPLSSSINPSRDRQPQTKLPMGEHEISADIAKPGNSTHTENDESQITFSSAYVAMKQKNAEN